MDPKTAKRVNDFGHISNMWDRLAFKFFCMSLIAWGLCLVFAFVDYVGDRPYIMPTIVFFLGIFCTVMFFHCRRYRRLSKQIQRQLMIVDASQTLSQLISASDQLEATVKELQ